MTLSLRDVKRSLTEQTIVEKAMELFSQRGFAQVSVRQIAKAAVVSEKTVFNYFPYKELIVLAGAQPSLAGLMNGVQQEIDNIADPAETLRKFATDLAEWCAANPEVACIVIAELLSPDVERLLNAARCLPDFYNPIRTVITLARAQGKLRPEVGVEYATDFFLSNVFTVIRTHVAVGELDRLRPMLNATLEIFLHGAFG
jgi:AcrR family transcriptional regulator